MIELRPVDSENVWDIIELSVRDDQEGFVASNTESILEAYTATVEGDTALPFGLWRQDAYIGFVMFGYGATDDEDEPEVAAGNYCLWRFMIDQRYQGRGLGREAAKACLDYLRTKPCGPAEAVWLSYEPDNAGAKRLYESLGFTENGEMCGDEVVTVLALAGIPN